MRYLFLVLFLFGCNSEVKEQPKEAEKDPVIITEFIDESSLWDIPQYYGENKDVPKYTAYGTYTNKHIPLAYWANDTLFHTYTQINDDGNFYVYAAKGNTEKVKVHTIENWNDPHTNGVIHVLPNGLVHVHIASRGLSHKFQSGKIYQSKTPYELDFECIDGCENTNVEAYPQVWSTKWGEHVGYTYYTKDIDYHPSLNLRELWYRVGDKRTQLVKGGHYAISLYDNGTLYLVYNSHDNSHPDQRINLYIMKTSDGENWTNIKGDKLTLPLEPFDDITLVYESTAFAYLKDVSPGPKVTFAESTTKDPTKGERVLKEWSSDGVKTISETNHNYNSASYFGDYVITTQDGIKNYGGGDMVLYKNNKEIYRDNSCNWNYVRKAMNNKKAGVVSCGFSGGRGGHYLLSVD